MDEPSFLGPPARRVGPSGTTEIFDGQHEKFMMSDFSIRINAKTYLGFTGREVVGRPLGDGYLGAELTDLLAARAKLRHGEKGFTGYFHLPSFYLIRRANGTDYVLVLAYGEWEPGRFLLQLEGVWKVSSIGPDGPLRAPPDPVSPPPVRLVVEPEQPRRPWWVRGRREPRGSFKR